MNNRTELGRAGFNGVVLLALLLAMDVPHAHASRSGARVVVAEYRHDFGDVFAGQFMDHVFKIRNEGTLPLTLSDVVPATLKSSWNSPVVPPVTYARVDGSSGLPASNAAIREPLILPVPIAARLSRSRSPEPVPT